MGGWNKRGEGGKSDEISLSGGGVDKQGGFFFRENFFPQKLIDNR